MELNDHERRVKEFKADLNSMDTVEVIRKHITTGASAVLSDSLYFDLRKEVAAQFKVHPSQVVVVGSCRMGFSLKPVKRFVAFTDKSDIDLAIVSDIEFNNYWDLAFDHWRAHRLWSDRRTYQRFLRELFKGWLWPRRLPPALDFPEGRAWAEFEDRLGKSRFGGLRSISARLYRNWDRLEAYQAIHVIDCKNSLHRGNS